MDPDPFSKFFVASYLLKVHLYHFPKIKSDKEVTKQYESRFFLLFLLDDRRIRIQEAQKHLDPMDPDPQHWLTEVYYRAEDVRLFASIARQQKFLGKTIRTFCYYIYKGTVQ
jgi:hypothetical protein